VTVPSILYAIFTIGGCLVGVGETEFTVTTLTRNLSISSRDTQKLIAVPVHR